MINCAVTFINF